MKFRNVFLTQILALMLLVMTSSMAETVVNWEGGFEVEVPNQWLRRDLGSEGLKLSSENVQMQVELFSGVTLDEKIEHVRALAKSQRYRFRSEQSFALNGVPAHEMIFTKGRRYMIHYIALSENRGFLWTVLSDSTDSEAFLESQSIIYSFKIKPR